MAIDFKKRVENFFCEHCGHQVKGNGYTNHCPACLWSKHVDIEPGDRAADCGGMMEPIATETKNGEERIIHKCQKCDHEKVNKVADEDNRDKIIEITQNATGNNKE